MADAQAKKLRHMYQNPVNRWLMNASPLQKKLEVGHASSLPTCLLSLLPVADATGHA